MKQLINIILFLFVFALLGYFRDYFFVQINNILYMKYNHTTSALPVGRYMKVFQSFSYDTLYYSKYLYTITWTALYFLANFFALRTFTRQKIFIMYLVYGYLVFLGLSFLSMTYGYIANQHLQDEEYTLSRWLMGIAQSPIPALILLAAHRLLPSAEEA